MSERCQATKETLTAGVMRQCPRPAKYGEWCRNHAESLGGWRLVPPALAAIVALARAREAASVAVEKHDSTAGGSSDKFWRKRDRLIAEQAAAVAALRLALGEAP